MADTPPTSNATRNAAWIGLVLGPLILLLCLLTEPPAGPSQTAWVTVGDSPSYHCSAHDRRVTLIAFPLRSACP